jgi:polysaccharide biosynthesis protein PelD
MHSLMPAKSEAPVSSMGRLAALHARARHRKILGVRLSAMLEVLAFVLVTVVVDLVWGKGQRFVGVTPHPLWIVVLLAASYYGLREALFATAVCAAAMLVGNWPAQLPGEGGYAWILRAMREPLLWLVASIVLGEIRDSLRRHTQSLREEVAIAQDRTDGLVQACDRLLRQKESLETRIADQALTVHAMYRASRAIERDGVGEVLVGVSELVRTSLSPKKFSLYLLNGRKLEAAVSEGWTNADRFSRVIEPDSPLFEAIVGSRRTLVIADQGDEALLRDEGLLAGPIINGEQQTVVGMLKIEAMDFLDLNAASVQNFRTLCEWIGAAITTALRLERTRKPGPPGAASYGRIAPAVMMGPLTAMLQDLVTRTRIDVSVVHVEMTLEQALRDAPMHAALAAAVDQAVQRACAPSHLCVATDATGGYVLMLPQVGLDAARGLSLRFVNALRQALEERGLHAMVRHRIGPLVDARKAA